MGKKSKSPKPQKSIETKVYRRNEKGKIIQWDRNSRWGKMLIALFDSGVLTNETAKVVKEKYQEFHNFSTKTLNSAIQNEHLRKKNEAEARTQLGSASKSICLVEVVDDDWLCFSTLFSATLF